jgi:hypothetical protein
MLGSTWTQYPGQPIGLTFGTEANSEAKLLSFGEQLMMMNLRSLTGKQRTRTSRRLIIDSSSEHCRRMCRRLSCLGTDQARKAAQDIFQASSFFCIVLDFKQSLP